MPVLLNIIMIIKRQCAILSLTGLFLLVLTANVYFVYVIVEDKSPNVETVNNVISISQTDRNLILSIQGKVEDRVVKVKRKPIQMFRNATLLATRQIEQKLAVLSSVYHKMSGPYKTFLHQLLKDLKPTLDISPNLWTTAKRWVGAREIVPERAPQLGSVLRTLCSTKIVRAENAQRGTQLKLMLTLVGNQKAIFKPQWYPRTELIEGLVYAGKDRHNAEVAAFHLAVLLGMRRSPLTVGRKVNLRREVMPVATDNLLDTFYQEGNNTCFYGVCYYCSPQDPVCAKQDVMEGALIMWLPQAFKLKKYRNPWQRTYKTEVLARWEVDDQYCDRVKATKLYNPASSVRLLDLVDAAIFDFLIGNGDRHHYEVFENVTNSMVLLLDNGKSFGNPHQDYLDILAPLYQCCMLRASTWERLQLFSGRTLSLSLDALLKHSHISPVLGQPHLKALDRRLLTVFAAVEVCYAHQGQGKVLVQDVVR